MAYSPPPGSQDPYGSSDQYGQPAQYGQTTQPGQPTQYGAPGQYGTPNQYGQYGTPGQYGQPGQYGTPGQYGAPNNPGIDPVSGLPYSDKSKLVAGLLGILLGGFGAGRFYTGHTGLGVAQLLVTIFTCGLGHFWGLIDGIMILTQGGYDAQGRPLNPSN